MEELEISYNERLLELNCSLAIVAPSHSDI